MPEGECGPSEEPLIRPFHRCRDAVVYLRQAPGPDTDHDEASLEIQRAQREHACRLGWSPKAVRVIEDYIGQGRPTAADRPGYWRLCQMIHRHRVGLVLVPDLSQICWSPKEIVTFFERCRRGYTLVAVDGRVVQSYHVQVEFMSNIRSTIAEFVASRQLHHGESTGGIDPTD